MISCTCTSSTNLDSAFPSITFTVGESGNGEVSISLKGSSYFKFNSGTNKCESMIKSNSALDSSNYWLMGTPIYRAFEIVHDMKDLVLGFKSLSTSTITQISVPNFGSDGATGLRNNMLFASTLLLIALIYQI